MKKGLFHKGFVLAIIFLFVGTFVTAPSISSNIIKKSFFPIIKGNTLYVGGSGEGNYSDIQDAIDNASNGDTVFVYSGFYDIAEAIIINKSIRLIGENKFTTIINGTGIFSEISDVYISGFTFLNGIGIIIGSTIEIVNNVTIYDNIFKPYEEFFWFGGIIIVNSSYNIISDNSFLNCSIVLIEPSYHNSIINNTINDKPLVYLEGASELVIEDAGQVILIDCNNITVKNLELKNLFFAIQIFDSVDCIFSDNVFYNNAMPGYFINSSNNIFSVNILSNNFYGLTFYYSRNNKVSKNSFQTNDFNFIFLNSSCNIISNNNFRYNFRRFNHRIISTESNNRWFRNFWNRPRLLPVIIWNIKSAEFKYFPIIPTSPDIDWFPAKIPNDINCTEDGDVKTISQKDRNIMLQNSWFNLFLDRFPILKKLPDSIRKM